MKTLDTIANEIRRDLTDIQDNDRDSLTRAINVGENLAAAKSQLNHGEWLPWLKKNFDLSQQTASEYMRLANYGSSRNFDSIASALSALKAEKPASKSSTRKPPKADESALKGKIGLSHDPDVVDWVEDRTRDGWTRDQIVQASKDSTDGWPRPGKHLENGGVSECRAAIAAKERARNDDKSPKSKMKDGPKQSGKRLRQLHEERRKDGASKLNEFQIAVMKAASSVEHFELPDDIGLSDEEQEKISMLFDDITILFEWSGHAFDIVVDQMGDLEELRKIKKVKDRSQDPSSGSYERANAVRSLERLEQKRRDRLRANKQLNKGA